ncbi:hypothetical protein F7725_016308 [Dissostichus mawsoni]|uniref:Uncharacterized protein n=1 Tax=Dissostichus mawsoni TaxID=36200 RepID=A0A7J5Z198_DISMA|nr:hypothetical protein F7725_016308 [Dissostichus mawsoni]
MTGDRNVPEVLQPLVLAQFSVQFSHLQAHQAQQDVQSVRLLPGLSETHHVVLEVPTSHHSLSVSFSVLSDSDELLSQKRSDVSVAVNEDPDWLIQRDRRQLFHLETEVT